MNGNIIYNSKGKWTFDKEISGSDLTFNKITGDNLNVTNKITTNKIIVDGSGKF